MISKPFCQAQNLPLIYVYTSWYAWLLASVVNTSTYPWTVRTTCLRWLSYRLLNSLYVDPQFCQAHSWPAMKKIYSNMVFLRSTFFSTPLFFWVSGLLSFIPKICLITGKCCWNRNSTWWAKPEHCSVRKACNVAAHEQLRLSLICAHSNLALLKNKPNSKHLLELISMMSQVWTALSSKSIENLGSVLSWAKLEQFGA